MQSPSIADIGVKYKKLSAFDINNYPLLGNLFTIQYTIEHINDGLRFENRYR